MRYTPQKEGLLFFTAILFKSFFLGTREINKPILRLVKFEPKKIEKPRALISRLDIFTSLKIALFGRKNTAHIMGVVSDHRCVLP